MHAITFAHDVIESKHPRALLHCFPYRQSELRRQSAASATIRTTVILLLATAPFHHFIKAKREEGGSGVESGGLQ